MHSNKTIIISKSPVIGKGLREVISSNFKTDVLFYSCFENFSDSFKHEHLNCALFVDSQIIDSAEVAKFLQSNKDLIIFQLVNSSQVKNSERDFVKTSLDISACEEDIINNLKSVLIEQYSSEVSNELSSRETDVLRLVAQGYSNKEIADKLFITVYTVMSHRKKITEKLGIKSISGLTVYSIMNNIIDTDNINLEDLI
jgi:DNA-binding CsgD family transcriptional regulator